MAQGLQLDGEAWMKILEDLSQALGREGPAVRLCFIGSAACLFGGMEGRTSADGLEVYRPPAENLVAAKLIRAEPKDLGDIRFLLSYYRPDLIRIRQLVNGFQEPGRERASENLVYLDTLQT